MPLQKLQFRPGIIKDVTGYTNEGGWRDSNLVRFRFGFPQSIGGWQKYNGDTVGGSPNTVSGMIRSLLNWVTLDSSNLLAVGTNTNFYIEESGIYNDITPIRREVYLDNPFTVQPGGLHPGAMLLVYDVDHGATAGDSLTISNCSALGGLLTAEVMNNTIQVLSVIDENSYYAYTYEMTVGNNNNGYGGNAVRVQYALNIGANTQKAGTGWGAGTFSTNAGGSPATLYYPFYAPGNLSGIIFVTIPNHQLSNGDYVSFKNCTVGTSGIPAAFMNQTRTVTYVVDENVIAVYFDMSAAGIYQLTPVTFGGPDVVAYYQSFAVLPEIYRPWGAGSTPPIGNTLRLWSQDNYGEDLIFNVRNGGIYYWDVNYGLVGRGVTLNSLSMDTDVPDIAAQIMVSDRDRHVIAFGANYGGGTPQDPLLIRFSDQEDPFSWTPSPTNSAGELRLGSGSAIIRAVETKREIIVFTDVAAYSLQYVGAPYTFSVQQIASGITVASYNGFATVDDTVFWMGRGSFYVYAGQTTPLNCPIQNHVFEDLNYDELDKICAGTTSQFGEITWFYPSANSQENNRYVTFNYMDKIWYHGNIGRSAWIDTGVRQYPMASYAVDYPDTPCYLYYQEYGFNDGTTNPESALEAYIESSPVDIGDGDKFWFIKRLLPDLSFVDSTMDDQTGIGPIANFVFKTQNYPGSNYAAGSDEGVTRTAIVPVEQYTPVIDVRIRGRSLIMRVESSTRNTRWILGSPRIEGQPDGKR